MYIFIAYKEGPISGHSGYIDIVYKSDFFSSSVEKEEEVTKLWFKYAKKNLEKKYGEQNYYIRIYCQGQLLYDEIDSSGFMLEETDENWKEVSKIREFWFYTRRKILEEANFEIEKEKQQEHEQFLYNEKQKKEQDKK